MGSHTGAGVVRLTQLAEILHSAAELIEACDLSLTVSNEVQSSLKQLRIRGPSPGVGGHSSLLCVHMCDQRFSEYTLIRIHHFEGGTPLNTI